MLFWYIATYGHALQLAVGEIINPNKAGLFEGSFSWGGTSQEELISRRTYLIWK